MKSFKSFAVFLFSAVLISAQSGTFSNEDVILKSSSKLLPERLMQISEIASSGEFSYFKKENQSLAMYKVSSNGNPDLLLTLNEIKESYKNISGNELAYPPLFEWTPNKELFYYADSSAYLFNPENKSSVKLYSMPSDVSYRLASSDFKKVAFTRENNLYVISNQSLLSISNEENKNIIYGQAVHRNEFGIDKGMFFSPDGKSIAFYKMDQTMVDDYPILETDEIPATARMIKYPMSGRKSHHVSIGIAETETGKIIYLRTDDPKVYFSDEQYLTSVTWSPDSKSVYAAVLNRDQNHLRLAQFNASDGSLVKILFEEKSDKYVEPENPLFFLPGNNEQFLWLSERDGWQHLYLHNLSSGKTRQITKGKWIVSSFEGFDPEGKYAFYYGTADSPLNRHYYRVNIANGKIEKITAEDGIHTVYSNKRKDLFIDSFNNSIIPGKVVLRDLKSKNLAVLLEAANPLADYKLGKDTIFTIKAEDGTDLYCKLIKPADFDASKKYPVIVYVYGGPHAQLVTNSFTRGRYDLWFQLMAQKGYCIFILDNRGSENRGLTFEQATFRNLSEIEIKDQLKGLDYLSTLSFTDTSRVGVFGWSYGGYMTLNLMLKTGGRFKTGVAGAPVTDWNMYEVMYTERYMDTPETNPEGYDKASVLDKISGLSGKLLIVHGTSDDTVVPQHTIKFVKNANMLNIPLDFYPYPGHTHGVYGIEAVQLFNKITNFFTDNL